VYTWFSSCPLGLGPDYSSTASAYGVRKALSKLASHLSGVAYTTPVSPLDTWKAFAMNLVAIVLILFGVILGQLVLLGVLDILNRP
jgi:hypothetical protein